MTLDFSVVFAQWPQLLNGLLLTVLLTLLAAVFGTTLGIACGVIRSKGPRWARWLIGLYVELIRNTPFIIQLFFIFFGLPGLGLKMTALTAAILANVINLGAYVSEIARSGIEATPNGQIEAAESLALDRWQIFTRVILPPALKRVWPALVGQMVIIMLGSAVCSQISTEELSYAANQIASTSFRNFETYIVVAGLYLLLSIALRRLLNWVGPHLIFGR
ncbi:amino acid ABC transporter permease [Pseudomonas abietaniphila]|uniref:Amino acid ABC transporter membrane protein 1, PAAT family n=1 Tax=Pseudomonas abietaniphila TaxID=89065 RepID=A0A1G7V0X5_9PSED|nr:amino acid ABC transporter permease [Pseudomonas abietaniphila]SDG53151.1 amino acid ABC transporter membrane protein 1, PAAT family [Pseudomonas abietaniphila]